MDKSLFNDLVTSLKEAQCISKGQVTASRQFVVEHVDAKVVCEKTGLLQNDFAKLMKARVET